MAFVPFFETGRAKGKKKELEISRENSRGKESPRVSLRAGKEEEGRWKKRPIKN